jgi:hypothetical protein
LYKNYNTEESLCFWREALKIVEDAMSVGRSKKRAERLDRGWKHFLTSLFAYFWGNAKSMKKY